MPAIARDSHIHSQYVTEVLDTSTVVLIPWKNRHRFFLAAHPDNTAPVWVRLFDPGSTSPRTVLPKDLENGDSAVGQEWENDATNSGIVIGQNGAFGDELTGQFCFDGLVVAFSETADQKLVVLEY